MFDHFIGGQWIRGQGQPFSSTNPATGEQVFQSRNADSSEVARAFQTAKGAFQKWAENSAEERFRVARNFASIVDRRRPQFVTAIACETGKPLWESNQELDTGVKKEDLSLSA